MPSPLVASFALVALALAIAAARVFVMRRRAPAPPYNVPARRETLRVGAREREFLAITPPSLPAGSPLLIVFHGGSGSPEQIRKQTAQAFDELADADSFAVAYPQGIGGNWNTCQKGRRNAATRQDVDDVGFVREIIAWFASRHEIDRGRVFAVGFSNGGHLCFRLALEMTDEIAGFATIAANRPGAADCRFAARHVAVPMLLVNGTADPINPYAGGDLSPFGLRSLGPVQSAEDTARSFAPAGALYRRSQAQGAADADASAAPHVTRHAWGGHNLLLTIHGGGHTIPQPRYAFPRLFGRTCTTLDAPLEIVRFFQGLAAQRTARPENTGHPETTASTESRLAEPAPATAQSG
ncbi:MULTISPECIES: alpha/beta hydrolase family esterase [unclassified Burkholderia]|uniref:alpha/beta hydrolase family esterase n=1 Tax=unclassified Burkholderia TaxID=2613784 RepID=UPI0011992A42|nr:MULTISPECIES: polyhydroxybutyrate depolymerase [unclassified Burkholderia]TWC59658.1 polyhydroxybutyrate depolymerase [Burkholderia sp. SJZ089]TWC94635.1 polyhydroxybutyrate depolymerase [Burkholderia sp. SJZ115]TWC96547.1 polyhydroxybutyrate depolymerase [Burkholderia sp. SJZ091]